MILHSFKSMLKKLPPYSEYLATAGATLANQNVFSYPGACGLSNLGNTCFMNSALQCLSNTEPLTTIILNEDYKKLINKENPLGQKGAFVEAYASLLRALWSGKNTNISPKSLKERISKIAPQFSGYNQQDSQELLIFLLDGLHEDLNQRGGHSNNNNLIDENEDINSKGLSNAELAELYWAHHKAKNDSVITDIFQGQLKSTIKCPTCEKESLLFEPFSFLSLPLPGYDRPRANPIVFAPKLYEVTVMWYSGNVVPRRYGVRLPSSSSSTILYRLLKDAVGPCLKLSGYALTQVKDARIQSKIGLNSSIQNITNDENRLILYQFPNDFNPASPPSAVSVYYLIQYNPLLEFSQSENEQKFMGLPFILFTRPNNTTNENFYLVVWTRLKRFLSECPLLTKEDVCTSPQETSPGENIDEIPSLSEEERICLLAELSKPPSERPFLLRYLSKDSSRCGDSLCQEPHCRGCPLPCNSSFLSLPTNSVISIDWHPDFYQHYYSPQLALNEVEDEFLLSERIAQKEDDKEKEKEKEKEKVSSPAPVTRATTLQHCLDAFSAPEKLTAANPWFCEHCKELRCAEKKLELWNTPDVLLLQLKRFSRESRDKITASIDFPLQDLDLSPYVVNPSQKENSRYELFAISCHMGGVMGGHYTAFAKNAHSKKWYYYDDSVCTEVPEPERRLKLMETQRSAYLFFYRRTET